MLNYSFVDQAASSSAAAATEEDVFSDDLMHDPFDGEVSDGK